MIALILAGGELLVSKQIMNIAHSSDFIIAADSGLKHAKKLNIKPAIIIGDFDSVNTDTLADFPQIKRKTYPAKKDKLDLELAIDYAIAKKAQEIKILGATGGRLDQTLAAILIAANIANSTKISLHSGKQDVFFLAKPSITELDMAKGDYFSLLSLSQESIISIKGAEFDLNHYQLSFGSGLGVSNLAINPPIKIALLSGLVAVIIEYVN